MATTFIVGQEAQFEATFTSDGHTPINPDTLPEFEIFSPTDVSIYTGISEKVKDGIYLAKWTVPGGSDIGNYRIDWKPIFGEVLMEGLSETFSVALPIATTEKKVNPYDIKIPDIELQLVKSILAYPCADEILLTDEQVLKYCIYPAMREYFTKFPLLERYQAPMNNYLEVPFPDQFVYGLTECRSTGKLFQSTTAVGSSFWQLVLLNKGMGFAGNSFNSYGSNMRGYNPNGLRQETRGYKYVLDTYSNDGTWNYNINKQKKCVEIYATLTCEVAITWARWSNNFEDVEYERRNEVIELAQGYLLQHFAQTIGLTDDGNAEQTLNAVDARTTADALMSRIREKWANMSDIIVMRIS